MIDQPGDSAKAAVRATVWNIRIDAAAAEALAALAQEGIDAIVLKGPALSDWYAGEPPRTYEDADIWVSPQHLERAGAVLQRLGYAPKQDERGLPQWWQEHAGSWVRESDGVAIDLHRRLQGARAPAALVWELLSGEREPLSLGGRPAQRLGGAARALYVTLHAAHDGDRGTQAVRHLERALTHVSEAEWRRAAELAEAVDARDAFAAGIRLCARGEELAVRLGLPQNSSVEAEIRANIAPPVALGFEQLAGARAGARIEILLRKLFPPPGFIRHWWAPAQRNAALLALGYLYRPLWLARHAPRGYRAWRAAHRTVEAQRRAADPPARSESSSR